MTPRICCVAALAAIALPGAAHACRGPQFASYVVLREPPSRLPPNARLLRVRLLDKPGYEDRRGGARAELREGRARRRVIRLIPDHWTSCDGWSEVDGPGYVVAFPCGQDRYEVIGYHSRKYRTPEQDRSEGISGEFRNCRVPG